MQKLKLSLLIIISVTTFGVSGGFKGKGVVSPESAVIGIPVETAVGVEVLSPAAVLIPGLFGDDDSVDVCSLYVGGGVIYNRVYSTDAGWFDDHVQTQDETGGLALLVGCDFSDYLAIEARMTKTYWDQDYSDNTTYGIMIKPKYPVTENLTLYALAGIGNVYVEGSSGDPDNDYSAWPDDIGKTFMDEFTFQWGIGASYDISEHFAFYGEYTSAAYDIDITPTRLYDYGDGTDANFYDKLSVDGLTVGILYYF